MIDLQSTTLWEVLSLVGLGLAPSVVWLMYFLKQDQHPEPKMMVLKVFLFGFCATFIAFGLEWAFIKALLDWNIACPRCEYVIPQLLGVGAVPPGALVAPFLILGVLALIEEWMKYAAARIEIIRSSFFDEPVDAMIYLIAAALGFAAAENIGYILQNADFAVAIAYFRFLSSTFLHVLASAIVGYFFALSLITRRHHTRALLAGLGLATALHAVFNFLIITSDGKSGMFPVLILMLGSFLFVSYLFRRVRHLSFKETLSPFPYGERIIQ